MLAVTHLEPCFVKSVPRELEPGVLYVSMEYGTVVHSCCCGCASEVVTPLTPTDWRLEFDGVGITLRPSVGNWTLPCRSHYIVRGNRVIECAAWNDDMVEAERRRDGRAKAAYYARADAAPSEHAERPLSSTDGARAEGARKRWMKRLNRWWLSNPDD